MDLVVPPGMFDDDTPHYAKMRWGDGSLVRFYKGLPQTFGGWESLTLNTLTGVCRNVLGWTDIAGTLNVGFGTHSDLQVVVGGTFATITPTLGKPPIALFSNRLTATNGSHVVGVNAPGHGLGNGDTVMVSGAANVGGMTPNGTFIITLIDGDSFSYVNTGGVAAPQALGANPLSVNLNDPTVTVHQAAHGLTNGATALIAGATAFGGITPNGSFAVLVVDADHWSYEFTSAATSAAGGGGAGVTIFATPAGGDAVVVAPQDAFAAGEVDGTGGSGYGTGGYGDGAYGEPSETTNYPRTWSLATYGQNLLANPRGGTIYQWENDTATPAHPLSGAPAEVSAMVVTNERQVLALGCNQVVSGEFNPLVIRGSDLEDPTSWVPTIGNNAFEDVLEGSGRLVAARLMGRYVVVWSDVGLYLGEYLGNPDQTYRWDPVATKCGLIGPNAVVVTGAGIAYWLTPDLQVLGYVPGGVVTAVRCAIQSTFDNIAEGQADKVVASTNSTFSEVRWDYPDGRDGLENSRYVIACTADAPPSWSRGMMARSAYCDAGPQVSPIGVTPQGAVYWHERGLNANGAALTAFLQSNDFYLDPDDRHLQVNGMAPDFRGQVGPVNVSFIARKFPQSTDTRTFGPFLANPGKERLNFRIEGRLVKVRLDSSAAPSFWRIGRPQIDDGIPLGVR